METKKDIGAAVKSRLEPFKDSPDDMIWSNIEGQLKKKKKRRAFVLWFSGLGFSVLLLMLWLVNPINDSVENNTIDTEIKTTDNTTNDNTTNDKLTTGTTKTNRDGSSSTETDSNTSLTEPSDKLLSNQNSVSEINNNTVSKDSNLKTDKHQNSTLKNEPKDPVSKILDPSKKSSHVTNNSVEQIKENTPLITKNEKRSTREMAIVRRDSLITSNKKIRDSIKEQRQSKRLVSEEKIEENTKDSIVEDDQSRWSVTPQATLSYYGALNAKTTDNFSINYGVLASYRMTEETYFRIGVRILNLNQTIDVDGTERRVEYLEFPLEVKFTPLHHKVNPYITGGLSYFKLRDGSNTNSINLEHKATMSLNLGLGLETKLFKEVYFNVETNFNYQLKPFAQKNSINPFIFSIHTGIEYRF